MKRRRQFNPLKDLLLQMRVAALRIDEPGIRRICAREAERIPTTLLEKRYGRKSDMVKMGRRLLRELPDMDEERLLEAPVLLRAIVNAVEGRFEIISETWLGRRRRRHDEYAAA